MTPKDHPPVKPPKIGVLLVNLGTPEATDFVSMRRYLKQFLSDRRVVEANRALWWLLLNGVILSRRPRRSGHAYAKVWNRERNESPLKTITRAQAEKLAARLDGVTVDWGMRYGLPAVGERFAAMREEGCDRILVMPLYPQYSATTTASVMDAVGDALKTIRWQPAVRTLPPYYDDPAYIDAVAEGLEDHLAALPWKPDAVLASFHGLPEDYLLRGDPYHCHCQKTARLLAERLGWAPETLRIVFQSRFGRAEWLKPYAQDTVEELAARGIKNLAMVMPGFAADCVETLEEVAIGLKETFLAGGGENFAAVPCLNDSAVSIDLLETLARRELSGWR